MSAEIYNKIQIIDYKMNKHIYGIIKIVSQFVATDIVYYQGTIVT